MSPPEKFTPAYRICHWILGVTFRGVYGMWAEGVENVPREGGCIIASNHLANLDPPVMGTALPHRQVYFMAKKELFQVPGLSHLLHALGTFPVERGSGDRRAMDRAVRLLAWGRVVGMYPEGTRSRDGRLGVGRLGVAALAARAGVPVVPAAVFGTGVALHERRMLPGGPPFGIRFGEPIPVAREPEADRARLEAIRDRIMAGIQAQLDQGPRAVAGRHAAGREERG